MATQADYEATLFAQERAAHDAQQKIAQQRQQFADSQKAVMQMRQTSFPNLTNVQQLLRQQQQTQGLQQYKTSSVAGLQQASQQFETQVQPMESQIRSIEQIAGEYRDQLRQQAEAAGRERERAAFTGVSSEDYSEIQVKAEIERLQDMGRSLSSIYNTLGIETMKFGDQYLTSAQVKALEDAGKVMSTPAGFVVDTSTSVQPQTGLGTIGRISQTGGEYIIFPGGYGMSIAPGGTIPPGAFPVGQATTKVPTPIVNVPQIWENIKDFKDWSMGGLARALPNIPFTAQPIIKPIWPETRATVGQMAYGITEGMRGYEKAFSEAYRGSIYPKIFPTTVKVPARNVPLYPGGTAFLTPSPEGGFTYAPSQSIYIPEGERTSFLGLGLETTPKILTTAPYLIPYVGAGLLTADALSGLQKISKAEDIAKVETMRITKEEATRLEGELGRSLTPEELTDISNQIYTQVLPQIKSQGATEAAWGIGLLATMGAGKVYGAVTKPIITTRFGETGKLIEQYGGKGIKGLESGRVPVSFVRKEEQFFSPTGSKPFLTRYEKVDIVPSIEAKGTTPIREFFGMKPKVDWVEIKAPSVRITQPILAVSDLPYYAYTGKVGKAGTLGVLKLAQISGVSEPLSQEVLKSMSKRDLFALRKTLEKVPYTREEVGSMSFGEIKARKLFEPYGKTTTTAVSSSLLSKATATIERPFGVAKSFDTFAGFKPSTKPFGRARGKVSLLPGRLTVLRLSEKGMNKLFPKSEVIKFSGGKTTFADTFKPVQESKTLQKIITKPIVKPSVKLPTLAQVSPRLKVSSSLIGLPRMVGGAGGVKSQFMGKGTYERTTSLGAVSLKPQTREVQMIGPQLKEAQSLQPQLKEAQIMKSQMKEMQIIKPQMRAIPMPGLALKGAQILKTSSRQVQITKATTTTTNIPRVTITPRPTIKVPPIPIPAFTKQSKKVSEKKQKKSAGGFLVFTKKSKKSLLVTPSPVSKGEALALGVKIAKTSERASFSIVPSNLKAKSIGIRPMTEAQVYSMGFRAPIRKGKLQPSSTEFIQTRVTRMGTPLEVRSIKSYKRGSIW